MKLIKIAACYVSVFSMAIAPLAEAKEKELQQKEMVNEYLKYTGLTTNKNLTVKEYWNSVRHVYPANIQSQMDQWAQVHGDQKMPTVQATTFKGADGKEQMRLILSTPDSQTLSLNYTGDEESPFKINNVSFSKDDLLKMNLETMGDRLKAKDASIRKSYDTPTTGGLVVMSYEQFKKMTPQKQVEYFVDMRVAMEAAVKVHELFNGNTATNEINSRYQWVRELFFGEKAFAGQGGQRCVVAGYISTIAEDGSCGGVKSGGDNLRAQARANGPFKASCPGKDTPCNPLVYGFDGSGNPFCAPRSQINAATSICSNSKSPLKSGEDKVAIVNSVLRQKNSKLQILLDKNGKVVSAKGQVLSEKQWEEVQAYLGELNGYIDQAEKHCANPSVDRDDQREACENLVTRKIQLERAGDKSVGALPDGKENCNWLCRNKKWLIPVGVVAGVGLLWWLLSGDKKKKKQTPVIGPTPTPTIPPIVPPPIIGPPPIAPPTEGGGVVDDGGNSGGVFHQDRGGK